MISIKRRETESVLILLLAAVCFSSAGLFTKVILWDPFSFVAVKCFVGLVFTFFYRAKHRIPNITGIIAGLGLCLGTMGFISSTYWGEAANAAVLLYTAPIFSALYLRLAPKAFRRSLPKEFWLTSLAILVGLIIMCWGEFKFNPTADFLGICGGAGFALWGAFSDQRKLRQSLAPIISGYFMATVLAVALACWATWGNSYDAAVVFDPLSWIAAISSGIAGALAFILYLKTTDKKQFNSQQALLIMSVEVPMNPLLVVLGAYLIPSRIEMAIPSWFVVLGGCIILVSVTRFLIINSIKETNEPGSIIS